MNFTDQQLNDFRSFKQVQLSARFNMFDPRAELASRLTRDEYTFVMMNYNKLDTAIDLQNKGETS